MILPIKSLGKREVRVLGNKNNLLIILAFCFIIIFIVIIFSVNSWLKQALKEETLSGKQVAAPVVYTEKTKYVQKPIEVVPVQQAFQPAAKKKVVTGGSVEGAARQGDSVVSPPSGRLLIN